MNRKIAMRLAKAIFAVFFLFGAAFMIFLAVARNDNEARFDAARAEGARQAAPITQQAKAGTLPSPLTADEKVAAKWGCKRGRADFPACIKDALAAEAEYQAQGGDAHQQAENEAAERPEFTAANGYFNKYLTARKSGGTFHELCALLSLAHLGYVQAGSKDQADMVSQKQSDERCPH